MGAGKTGAESDRGPVKTGLEPGPSGVSRSALSSTVLSATRLVTIWGLLVMSGCANFPGLMRLDDGFLAVADSYEAEAESFHLNHYSFGEYRIVSFNAGPGRSDSNREFLGSERTEESEGHADFILVGEDTDRVLVRLSRFVREVYFDRALWNDNELQERADTIVAELLVGVGQVRWDLELVTRNGNLEIVEGGYQTGGYLASAHTRIELDPVFEKVDHPDDPALWAWGYRFVLEGRTVAAVQTTVVSAWTAHKKNVWIRRDLDPSLRLALAGAAATLLVN